MVEKFIGGRKPLIEAEKKYIKDWFDGKENVKGLARIMEAGYDSNRMVDGEAPITYQTLMGVNTSKNPGCCELEQFTEFQKAALAATNAVVCETCHGRGHQHMDCPTRVAVDALAKHYKVSWVWGAIKGACYYDAWSRMNILYVSQMKQKRYNKRFYKSR